MNTTCEALRATSEGRSFRERSAVDSNQISPLEEEVLLYIEGASPDPSEPNRLGTYGFQISQAFEKISSGERKLSVGTLYPLLSRLEKKGLITSQMADKSTNKSGGARRKYFAITSKGSEALAQASRFRLLLREYARQAL